MESEGKKALHGCLIFIVMFGVLIAFVAHLGRSSDAAKAPAEAQAEPVTAAPVSAPAGNVSDTPSSSDAKVAKAVEQIFPDPVDHSGSARYQKEWWMVKGAVKQAGYPCAAVALVKQNLDGTFEAACKVAARSNKYMVFEINPDAQTVVPLTRAAQSFN